MRFKFAECTVVNVTLLCYIIRPQWKGNLPLFPDKDLRAFLGGFALVSSVQLLLLHMSLLSGEGGEKIRFPVVGLCL